MKPAYNETAKDRNLLTFQETSVFGTSEIRVIGTGISSALQAGFLHAQVPFMIGFTVNTSTEHYQLSLSGLSRLWIIRAQSVAATDG